MRREKGEGKTEGRGERERERQTDRDRDRERKCFFVNRKITFIHRNKRTEISMAVYARGRASSSVFGSSIVMMSLTRSLPKYSQCVRQQYCHDVID